MKKNIFLLLIIIILFLGCVTTQDFNQLQQQVAYLRQNQNQEISQTQQKLQQLEKTIQEIEKKTLSRIDNSTSPVRSIQANLWSEVEDHKRKLAILKGNQEEIQLEQDRIGQMSRNNTQDLDEIQKKVNELGTKLDMLASQLGVEIEKSAAPKRQTGAAETEAAKNTPDIIYERALISFRNRDYQEALSLWTEFAKDFPEHELVDNSYFWQGECNYQLKKYKQAVLAYQQVIEKYPKSSKIPAAKLKQGLSFYKLDKAKAGKIVLQELIDKYPQTAEAKRAKAFLSNR